MTRTERLRADAEALDRAGAITAGYMLPTLAAELRDLAAELESRADAVAGAR